MKISPTPHNRMDDARERGIILLNQGRCTPFCSWVMMGLRHDEFEGEKYCSIQPGFHNISWNGVRWVCVCVWVEGKERMVFFEIIFLNSLEFWGNIDRKVWLVHARTSPRVLPLIEIWQYTFLKGRSRFLFCASLICLIGVREWRWGGGIALMLMAY